MRISRQHERAGAATVELAVLLPFLMFICVIGTDWARLLYFTITIDACARNGALYASDSVTRANSPYTNLTEAAKAEAPTLDATSMTVTQATATDSAGAAAVFVTVTIPFSTITNFPGVPSSQTLTRKVQMRVAPLATK